MFLIAGPWLCGISVNKPILTRWSTYARLTRHKATAAAAAGANWAAVVDDCCSAKLAESYERKTPQSSASAWEGIAFSFSPSVRCSASASQVTWSQVRPKQCYAMLCYAVLCYGAHVNFRLTQTQPVRPFWHSATPQFAASTLCSRFVRKTAALTDRKLFENLLSLFYFIWTVVQKTGYPVLFLR